MNAAVHEGCAASNDTILTLRAVTRRARVMGRRLVYECHGKGTMDEVAAFLCGAGEDHYYGFGGWVGVGRHGNFSGHWLDGVFGRRLGAPAGDAVYNRTSGVWTRRFGAGVTAHFDAVTQRGVVSWG